LGDMAMVGREAATELGLWQREHLTTLPLERGGNVQRWDPLLILLSDLGPHIRIYTTKYSKINQKECEATVERVETTIVIL
jgi:hypothetical protein